MIELNRKTLGEVIFQDIDTNGYLMEIYDNILYKYAIHMFKSELNYMDVPVNINDALQFADLLSNSEHYKNADQHKIMAQEMLALLHEMYPEDKKITYYLTSVLSNVGNYRGISIVKDEGENLKLSFMDRLCQKYDMDKMSIPSDPQKQFFKTQARVYRHLSDQYFSYSGPTSMGKSFILRMFIKKQILDGIKKNYVILVPTKALINEVSNKIIKEDLRENLVDYNYRVVNAGGDLVLKQEHNFIFVLTPERLLYLMIDMPTINIDYLFIDEAHKISSKDDRSTFYYQIVEMLSKRDLKPHIVFASPNIPNPEIYLDLVGKHEKYDGIRQIASTYSPVSQMKYIVDYNTREMHIFNDFEKKLTYVKPIRTGENFNSLLLTVGANTQNIVYCSSINRAVTLAREYAETQADLKNAELSHIAKEIKQEVHGDYFLADVIVKGVAYHIGYLPTTIRMRIEELFRKGLIRTLFCTSTLVEGVNLPADNLFVTNYMIGRAKMNTVDFKNLIGRVGRIEYNLYGNVFLICQEKVKKDKFVELLTNKLPEQKLSIQSGLTKPQKKMIVENLLKGEVELPKHPKSQSVNNYSLMRKFSIILLNDIICGRESFVKKEFESFLSKDDETKIAQIFQNSEKKVDEDINISADQINNLMYAVRQGLYYPVLTRNPQTDYDNLVEFLEQLCRIFKWDKYEANTLGHKNKANGAHGKLRWYAVILLQWINGNGLSFIMTQAIEYKINTPGSTVIDKDGYSIVPFENTKEHRNSVISEVLWVIENVVLYRISNYFLKFSNAYKNAQGIEHLHNDWYEYVEYGTTNPLSILLQQSGFTRETSTFIKMNREDYIVEGSDGQLLIRKCILECGKDSVEDEVEKILYNMPEIFI